MVALTALAPEAIRELHDELNATFTQNPQQGVDATPKPLLPALTIAIRTNGVEHGQAAQYVQLLLKRVLGLQLSEQSGTLRRYIVAHEDKVRARGRCVFWRRDSLPAYPRGCDRPTLCCSL
eukprot:4807975-Prymnesium_polylepis.1